tara:strand:+ start:238 stop:924 length:687 start_codon:yes stop_codon:yes gene_type:complete
MKIIDVNHDKFQWILKDIEAFSFFDKKLGEEIFDLFVSFFDKKILESYTKEESIIDENGETKLIDFYSEEQVALFFEFRTALYRVQQRLKIEKQSVNCVVEEKQQILSGDDLLQKVRELRNVTKSELVRSCGYISKQKNGKEKLNFTAFYEALINAKNDNTRNKKWSNPKDTSNYLNISTKTLYNLRSKGYLSEGICWTRKTPSPNSHVIYDIEACDKALKEYRRMHE